MTKWPQRPRQCASCLLQNQRLLSRTSVSGDRKRNQSEPVKSFVRLQTFRNERQNFNDNKASLHGRNDQGLQGLFRNGGHSQKQETTRQGHFRLKLEDDRNGPELTSDEREQRLLLGLNRVYDSMRRQKFDEDSENNQLQELDPEHISWGLFKLKIIQLVKNRKNKLTESDKTLLQKLKDAELQSRAAVDRELYFAFLDYVLDKQLKETLKSTAGLSADLRYPTEWYARARAQQREIHLHVGPTNSGKTYTALKRLQESGNGFYAGPLRLLAHEVYSRFQANGVPCDLVTGDDVRFDDDVETKVAASTVEMVDTNREVEVAVIDEIQMMGNEERGWAWTRAFLGANAKEVHLAGETRVVPLVRELAASIGDTLHVHNYERLNPLKAMSRSLRGNLKNLRKGDCVVAFTIARIQALKREIELETGRRVAIVYGGLPPETRAQQAELFNDPESDYDYLVASDAIGMGLNLSVKRIIFETLVKPSGGIGKVQLSIPQIKQIAGRAGRFRTAYDDKTKKPTSPEVSDVPQSVGLVTCIDEKDLPLIQQALHAEPPPLRKAGIIPPVEYIQDFAARLPAYVPFEYILQRIYNVAKIHPRFQLCNVRDSLALARAIEGIPDLSIAQRVVLTAAPASKNNIEVVEAFKAFARALAERRNVTVADIPEIPLEVLDQEMSPDPSYLSLLEVLHKSLILYLWLSYRYSTTFTDQPMAMHAKALCEEKINRTLREFSANKRLRSRLSKIKREQQKLSSENLAGALNGEHNMSEKTPPQLETQVTDVEIEKTSVDWSEHPSEEQFTSEEEREGSADVQRMQEPTKSGDIIQISPTRVQNDVPPNVSRNVLNQPYQTSAMTQGSQHERQQDENSLGAAASG